MKITEKEVKKRLNEICGECKHTLSYHIFWDHRGYLKLVNCNECFCDKFAETVKEAQK